jgi:predicted nucleic acid-binding protein
MAFVVDASIVVKWFLEDEMTRDADVVLDRVRNDGAVVPALFRWETQNVLTRAVLDGRLTRELLDVALEELAALPIAVEHPGQRLFFGGETDLALRYDITPYDAAYLAVAIDYRLDLATADNELARAARDADIRVMQIK